MRTPLALLCFLALASLRAEDLTLSDGTVFKNATVTSVTPAYISVTHSAGVAHVILQDLPQDLQKKYGFDREKAAKFTAADAVAQQRLAQQQAIQQQQATKQQQQAAEQHTEQQHERNLEQSKAKVIQIIRQSQIRMRITSIKQITDAGVLMGGMNADDSKGRFIGVAGEWFLVGYDTSGSIDGAEIGGFSIFAAGTYRFAGKTMPRYAASPEIAYKLILADQMRKRESDDESKRKLPTDY